MTPPNPLSPVDTFITHLDLALRTLCAPPRAGKPCPTAAIQTLNLSPSENALSGALMRVNHVGEVCAQALYAAQAFSTKNPALRQQFIAAGHEEGDHLAWTRQRLDELGARPSLLNPIWYAGAFALGLTAGRLGDPVSLGFLVETERQVETHLANHMERLPLSDHASRAIVEQMKDDEARHAREALALGATDFPCPLKNLMEFASKVMTTVAHRI